jgi:hypothetical protein
MKTCFKCGVTKPLPEFYRHSMMADGHLNKCKSCTKKDVHEHRHGAGREKVLAYDRKRADQPHRRESMARRMQQWGARFPERRRAHSALRRAVIAGRVVPWPVCAVPECSLAPEAHHPDYSRPLDVVWLCSAHHKQAHALVGQSKREEPCLAA